MPNPLENNWYVSSILKGVKRVKGNMVSQKLPIIGGFDWHPYEVESLS